MAKVKRQVVLNDRKDERNGGQKELNDEKDNLLDGQKDINDGKVNLNDDQTDEHEDIEEKTEEFGTGNKENEDPDHSNSHDEGKRNGKMQSEAGGKVEKFKILNRFGMN